MAVSSAIEGHPQQHRIVELILSGASLRKVGQSVVPPVSKDAVQHYKRTTTDVEMRKFLVSRNSMRDIGVNLQSVQSPGGTSSLVPVAQLEVHKLRLLGTLGGYAQVVQNRLPKSKTDNGAAALINAGRGTVETEARILGLLQEQANPTILILNASGGNVTIGPAVPEKADPEDRAGLIDIAPDDDITRR